MARIRDAKGRGRGSGYGRLFGDAETGHLISKVQAAVITAGTELERLILDKVTTIPDLDAFLAEVKANTVMPEGVFVAPKKAVKKCASLKFEGAEPDLLIFRRRDDQQECSVVELKDGDNFDTKKSEGERDSMRQFVAGQGAHLPFVVRGYFCCFNQDSKQAIVDGFKRRITIDEAMTGRGLCDLLEIDYDEIVAARTADQADNLNYFVHSLLDTDAIRAELVKPDLQMKLRHLNL